MSEVLAEKRRRPRGKAETQWGMLTDDDIVQIEGDCDKLVGKLQEWCGWEKAEAHQSAETWFGSFRPWTRRKRAEGAATPPCPCSRFLE
jgi:uncharacterized protein YjbJ (UPF0337 family)